MSDTTDLALLIEDTQPFKYEITEDAKDGGRIKLRGIYQLGEVINNNKRRYSNGLWERVCAEGSPFQQKINRRRVLGELGHPKDGRSLLERASHLVTKVWLDKNPRRDCVACEQSMNPGHNHVMAEEEVLNTPHGKILGELYRSNVEVCTSSRGRGTLVPMGEYKQVSDNYQLETWDHVLDPSTPGAIPRVVTESVVDAVGRFISTDTSPAELQGYQSVLSEVLSESLPEDLRSSAQAMIDTIAVRLANTNRGRVSVAVPSPTTTLSEETPMSAITKDLPEVRQIVADALAAQASQFDTQFKTATETIDELRRQLAEAEDRNSASADVGNELVSQLKEAQIKLDAYKGAANGSGDLIERFENAKAVIEELVSRVRGLRYAEARADAAEKLLSEVVARTQRDRLMQHVDRLTQSLPESIKPKMREMLAEATSIADANRRFSALSTMINEAGVSKPVVEDTETPAAPRTESARPAATAQTTKPSTDGALPAAGAVQETLNESTEQGRAQQVNEQTMIARGLVRRLNPVRSAAAAR